MSVKPRLLVLLAIVAGLLNAAPARTAELTEADYARVNAALVHGYVLPRVEALQRTAHALERSLPDSCAIFSGLGLQSVRAAFVDANSAWMRIRHLAFGPLELFMRANRFQFSPDPDGRVARDLAEAIAKREQGLLAKDKIARAPVDLQGFSALEHLLFDDKSATRIQAGDDESTYRCRLASAIAGNIAAMADGVAADWKGGGSGAPFVDIVTAPGPDNPYYQTHRDATLQFFKSLYGGLQVIVDIKLGPPLGASLDKARPDLVESGPSGASLDNIVASLESLALLYSGPDGKGGLGSLLVKSGADEKLVALLPRAFDITLSTARSIDVPLARAVHDPAARPRVEKLHLQVRALKQLISRRLADAIGLAVGFNALDGD